MTKKLMLKQLASMLASFKRKKKYYCEVEFLESTGTQYIDTGIYGTENTSFKANLSPNQTTDYSTILGSRTSSDVNRLDLIFRPTGLGGWFGYGTRSGAAVEFSYSSRSRKVFLSDKGKCYIDGSLVGSKIQMAFRTPTTLKLFCNETNGTRSQFFYGKLYDIKIWDNGVLVRDMIPVLDWNMTPCMYDRVSGELFYNSNGSGSGFTYGREIHPVEYIEAKNSGGDIEYAVGNYRLTNTTDLEITFSASANDNNWVIGQPSWIGVHYRKDTSTSNLPRVGITNGSTSASQCYVDYTDDEKITLALKGTDVYANGVKVGSITRVSAPATQTKYGIFAYKDISQDLPNLRIKNARIYRLKIWDNDVLVQDLIPAIDENGIGGFFENVNRTFIDKESNSTSDFKYPAREVEYLKSTGTQYIDTGLTLSASDIIYTKTYLGNSNSLFGVITSDSNYWYNMTSLGRFYFGSSTQNNANLTLDQTYEFEFGNTYKVNGETKFTFEKTFGDGNLTCPIFCRNHTSSGYSDFFVGKVYYFKIVRNGTIRCDFIPAYKDGQAGFLNKVDGTFFTNSGTGQFLTGKIIEAEYE